MRSFVIILAALIFGLGSITTGFAQTKLDSVGIVQSLTGNSILHPSFGCVHFENEQDASIFNRNGYVSSYTWRVENGLYFSSIGGCGQLGCEVWQDGNGVRFLRLDGTYNKQTLLQAGNACERGALSS